MFLTPSNSTEPKYWGKFLKIKDGLQVIESLEIPKEIDFIKEIYPKDPAGAKLYYGNKIP